MNKGDIRLRRFQIRSLYHGCLPLTTEAMYFHICIVIFYKSSFSISQWGKGLEESQNKLSPLTDKCLVSHMQAYTFLSFLDYKHFNFTSISNSKKNSSWQFLLKMMTASGVKMSSLKIFTLQCVKFFKKIIQE